MSTQPRPSFTAQLIEDDFLAVSHGSLILLHPVSDLAKAWVHSYLPDDAQWFGQSVVIEPRYFDDIACGIVDAGLTLS